jgi:hypothetical protein
MSESFLIFSGYNQRAVIAFCRVAVTNNIPFCIIAKSSDDAIFKTKYRDCILAVRNEKPLTIEDVDRCIDETKNKSGFAKFVILPSSEFLNRFFLDNRSYYDKKGCSLPLVDKDLYMLVSDKLSFGRLCMKYGIEVPSEYSSFETASLPFVAKPIKYFSSKSGKALAPVLLFTESDKSSFLKEMDADDFYYQAFVDGSSYYLLYYISADKYTVSFSQKNLVQQAEGKSMIYAIGSDIHKSQISDNYINMLKDSGFKGLIMIELRKDNNKYLMIEANPRLWGPSQLFVDAGVPIFERFIQEQGFKVKENLATADKDVFYYWNGGICEDIRNGKKAAFHDFSQEKLDAIKQSLLEKEIYLREDTIEIYHIEAEGLC